MRPRIRSATVLAALAIGVGACGSESTTTAPSDPTATAEPAPTSTSLAPAPTTSETTTTVVAATTPAIDPPTRDVTAALTGWNWGYARIDRACGEVWWQQQQMNQLQCTSVAVDPQGVPVSYDPVTRLVTRERREGAEPVAFTLSEEYVDASLLAAGPDGVVYVALDNRWPSPADVVAFSLAPDDAGRLIERFPEALPIVDADVMPTTNGLVVSGWYDEGPRPAHDAAPVVPWVSRDGGSAAPVAMAAFDDAMSIVQANGWQWHVDERTVVAEQPGSSSIVTTFDGGFLLAYSETTGAMRTELIRGWRDGAVEYRQLPEELGALGQSVVLEPQGTLLLPSADSFVRLAPFETRATGWDGGLDIDVEAGTASPVGLDEYLDSIVWPPTGQAHLWPWGTGPLVFANAVAGGSPTSPSELRTIEEGPVDGSIVEVTVTTEGYLDDSVHGTRLAMRISTDQPGFRIAGIEWSNTCQPGRGHQDYRADYCV
jgi:hypothetical protein